MKDKASLGGHYVCGPDANAGGLVLPRLDLARLDSTSGRLPVTSGDLQLVVTSKSQVKS